jgi:LacI family transcriptional regulator
MAKRTTSFDVAKAAGVSRSVVSAVINGTAGIGVGPETREKVLKAIKELDYHVDAGARAMKTGVSRCVAAFGDMKNPLFLQVLEGMQRACAERGYHVLISGKGGDERDRFELLDLYRQRRLDGIISLDAISFESREWLDAVRKAKVPYISIEGYAGTAEASSILVDYRESILDVLDHIGAISSLAPVYLDAYLEKPGSNWAERARRSAYERWCLDRGLAPVVHELQAYNEAWMLRFLEELRGRENGKLPPILINWSVSASILYRAAWKLGIAVGKELSVMAGDNTNRSNAFMAPPLGCVEIPYAEMGEEAVRRLILSLEEPSQAMRPEKLWLKATVVPGESMARER